MHGHPLVYFRSSEPLDIQTFERIDEMVGTEEEQVTYPEFFRGPDDELVFTYRGGVSGQGIQIYNQYDPETQTWSRLLDQPLLDGRGEMSAYLNGPTLGPDGYFHLEWMWRDTGSAATNHTLSYARSANLVNWETADGEPLDLPITPETEAVVVDPVPPYGGMINMNHAIGFDQQDRVVLSYHKYVDIQETDSTLTVPNLTGADWIWYPEFDENTRREGIGRTGTSAERSTSIPIEQLTAPFYSLRQTSPGSSTSMAKRSAAPLDGATRRGSMLPTN